MSSQESVPASPDPLAFIADLVPPPAAAPAAAEPATDPIWQAITDCHAGKFELGVPVLLAAIEQTPNHVPALLALGAAHGQMGRLAEACHFFERVIEIDPKLAQAYSNLGNALKLQGKLVEAVTAYRTAITLQPGMADGHYNLSTVLNDMGDLEEAEKSLERALLFKPAYPEAHNNLGDIQMRTDRLEAATSHFRQALVWNPDLAQAQANLLLALYKLGLFAEADDAARRALEKRPGDIDVLRNQAMGLVASGRPIQAEKIYRQLIELDPQAIAPRVNLGGVLQMQRRYEEAIEVFAETMKLKDANPSLCLAGIAGVRIAQDQPAAAVAELQHAVMLEGRHAGVLANLGWAQISSGEAGLGIQNLRRAGSLAPNMPELCSSLIYGLHFDANLTPEARFAAARDWDTRFGHPEKVMVPLARRELGPRDRLRIGFVSADFRMHSVAQCLEPLLKHYDKSRIEISLFAVSPQEDEVSQRFKGYVDLWRSVTPMSAKDLAERVRRDGIDILIDLSWHTGGNRLSMFAHRPAAVHITWLGFFASTGLDAIDYRLTDDIMDPIGQTEAIHSERLLYLPSVLTYQPPQDAPPVAPLPMLTRGSITFASISKFNRASPAALDAWAQILHALPEARLIMFTGIDERDTGTLERIRRLFALRDIDEERLDIRPRLPLADFLGELSREADVVLDTFPYPGGVGTLHALWMGLPTVTLAGSSSFERAGASVMSHAGLDAFVTHSVEDYIAKAVSLASDAEGLAQIRGELRARLESSLLLDGAEFAKTFTDVLIDMWNTPK